jgi:hypothetical protein
MLAAARVGDRSTIALARAVILRLACHERKDSAKPTAPKKQAARTVYQCACLWTGRIPGILQ